MTEPPMVGTRVWAPHPTAKSRIYPEKPEMRRCMVEGIINASFITVRDVFSKETWRCAVKDCTTIVDSGEAGRESAKHQKALVTGASSHFAEASKICRDSRVFPAVRKR